MDTSGNSQPVQARVYDEERKDDDQQISYTSSELTLSFNGQLHVFPTVPPEKVEAALLRLGGREIARIMSSSDFLLEERNKILGDASQNSNLSPRAVSLDRFHKKRKERCFEKKIRYSCRKEIADRMHRNKGKFASSKESSDSGDSAPQPERICRHCGVGEKSTPSMRKGPAGPGTLCNACGLMWAKQGILRDLSKLGRNNAVDQSDSGSLEENQANLMMDSGNLSDFLETAQGVSDDSPAQIRDSAIKLDVQENLEETGNASGTDFDISLNFDEAVDIGLNIGTNWLGYQ